MASPLRCLVLFFNFLFFVFGLILLGIGIWGELTMSDYFELAMLDNYGINTGPRLLIAVGAIITVVSFFGCCGAWKENRCMLIIFLVLLVILLVLEIAAAAVAYNNKDKLKKDLAKEIKSKIEKYKARDRDVDDFQEKLNCCGANDYKDWNVNVEYKQNLSVPDSCCKKVTKACGKNALSPVANNKTLENINQRGCYQIVLDDNDKIMGAIGGVAIALLVIQILGIICAIVLIVRMGSKKEIN
ncbi:tetraspanin-9-like [Actinia tenebrosa]|uniref:Tetraspanin n=1 Tax=Actinia tenebrosa TaxID=6105 RepID=A0A6P8HND0_ACTTE|nr:tetraspanin-9-like [Actinia tenebrosa]